MKRYDADLIIRNMGIQDIDKTTWTDFRIWSTHPEPVTLNRASWICVFCKLCIKHAKRILPMLKEMDPDGHAKLGRITDRIELVKNRAAFRPTQP